MGSVAKAKPGKRPAPENPFSSFRFGGKPVEAEVYLLSLQGEPIPGGRKAPSFMGRFARDPKRPDKFITPFLMEPPGYIVRCIAHGERAEINSSELKPERKENGSFVLRATVGGPYKSGIFLTVEVSKGNAMFPGTFAINAFVSYVEKNGDTSPGDAA